MFKSETDKQFVPSKTISVFPEVQSDFTPRTNNVVRWFIPPSVGFFDPRYTSMKYKLQMSGRGINKPDPKAGVHSLWRDMRIRDGSGITELEFIQDYNALTASMFHYTENDSISNARSMFQGQSKNTDINQQLFYGPTPKWSVNPTATSPLPLEVEISQPIFSGVLGGDRIFPVAATKGLRCEMFLDQVQRSLVQNTTLGNIDNFLAINTPILGATGTDDTAKQSKTAIDTVFTCDVIVSGPDGRGVNDDENPTNNNPFDIGDPLYIALVDGSEKQSLGIITGFTKEASNRLVIQYIPDRPIGSALGVDYPANSVIYYQTQDRVNGKVVTNVPSEQVLSAGTKISYTISDLQMLLLQVQPPQQYVEAMMKQLMGKGLTLDFTTSQLYRFNLSTLNGLTSQLIPATQTRAYSILSLPLDQSKQNDISVSSFKGIVDGSTDYQYSLGTSLIPDRPIELSRLTQTPPRAEVLALLELEKALTNAGKPVRNVLRPDDNFMIGRGFSRYGQVSDLSSESLSLRVSYDGATVQKMFDHFVIYLKRIMISSDGVTVV